MPDRQLPKFGKYVIVATEVRRARARLLLRWEWRVRYKRVGDTGGRGEKLPDSQMPPKTGRAWTRLGAMQSARIASGELSRRNRADEGWKAI